MTSYGEMLDAVMGAIMTDDVSEASDFIDGKENFTPEQQLAVYVEGYRMRLNDAIEAAYPASLYAFGKDEFRRHASRFIEATPSRHFNIEKYPVGFSNFITRTVKDVFLHDLVQLESAIHAVYQDEESDSISKEWIEKQTPETMAGSTFLPRSASRLLMLSYPADDYLTAFRADTNPKKPARMTTYLLIYRNRNQVQRLPLSEAEYTLFSILASGKTLDNALENERFAPYVTSPDLPKHMMGWFSRWVGEGCLRQPV